MNNTNRLTLSTAALTIFFAPMAVRLPAQLIPPVVTKDLDKQPATGLNGTWRGTATETVEGAGELSFPIQMRFSGPSNKLRLVVSGQAKVPSQNGQLTVEIEASYIGKLSGQSLMMQSQQIRTRIVETGQTLPSSSQTLTAKLANGVLSGKVGSVGEGFTQFTARQSSAQPKPDPKNVPQWSACGTPRPRDGPRWSPADLPGPDADHAHPQRTARPDARGGQLPDRQRPNRSGRIPRQLPGDRAARRPVLPLRPRPSPIPSQNRTENAPAQQGQAQFRNGELSIQFGTGNETTSVTLRPQPTRGPRPSNIESSEEVVIDGDEQDDDVVRDSNRGGRGKKGGYQRF